MPRLPKQQPVDRARGAFEAALAREILASERRRVTILAAVLGGVLLFWLLSLVLFPTTAELEAQYGLVVRRSVLIATLAGALAYELIVRIVIGHFLRTGRQPLLLVRYVNALVETSLPCLATLITASAVSPASALLLPPPSFFFLFILLSTLRLDFWLSFFTGAVAAIEYAVLAAVLLEQPQTAPLDPILTSPFQHAARSFFFLLVGLLAGLVALQIKRQFVNSLRSVEDRNRVVSMFGQHVSPEVVEKLLSQPLDLGGEVRHVCLMFLDIRDFTAFSATKTPQQVVEYLNALFDFMIDSVNRHHGIVNKFLGDGFLAVFGAPISDGHDSRNAVAAALDIVEQLETLNGSGRIPPTRIGIGLHAGDAVTGNVGSTLRKEYTIIGDVVNLASRIEQLNKQFGSCLLISEEVRDALDGAAAAALPLGPIQVKGRETPVSVYRLV